MKRILFAFGTHGEPPKPPNREFFRDTVSPFLEELADSGRRGIVIHEGIIPLEMDFRKFRRFVAQATGRDCLHRIEKAQAFLRRETAKIIDILSETADKGRPAPLHLDVGFNDTIMRINSRAPGTILNIIEPQSVHTSLAVAHDGFASSCKFICRGNFGPVCEALDVRIKNIVFRDMLMIRLLRDLLENHPEMAIIVPRGTAHSHLAKLAESVLGLGRDDIASFVEDERSAIDLDLITSDAVERAYRGQLDFKLLVFYALKWTYFMNFSQPDPLEDGFLPPKEADRDASVFARKNLDAAVEALSSFKKTGNPILDK